MASMHVPVRVLVLLLAVTGLLVGCGGSGGSRSDSVAAGTAAAPAPAFAPEKAPQAPAPEVERDIVKTASITLSAGDPVAAADAATRLVSEAKGRVDSRSENAGSSTDRAYVRMVARVPADQLDDVIEDLKALGTPSQVEVQTDDVTARRVDLDARITALQTSVDRLLAIMREAGDPEALVKAEEALSQRQADLDSLRAQRAALGEQIAYSTITLDIRAEQVGGPQRQYNGFFGQVQRGWDTMTSLASNSLMVLGFLLPWLGVLALVAGAGYGVSWLLRRR